MTDEIKPTKKYEFTGETKIEFGVTFKRIRALVTIPGVVVAGAIGGWVEDERNLSQVSDKARVFGEAQVFGEARCGQSGGGGLMGPWSVQTKHSMP